MLNLFRVSSVDKFRIIRHVHKFKAGRVSLNDDLNVKKLRSKIALSVLLVGIDSPLRLMLFIFALFIFIPYFILISVLN